MLSFYDAVEFGTQKKNFFWGIFLALCVFVCVALTVVVLQQKFLFLSVLKMAPEAHEKNLFMILRDSAFWATLSPKTLHVFAIILATVFVFFAQELIVTKKKLFNLSMPSISFSFLFCTLCKLLILFLPIAIIVSVYMHDVLHSVFSYGIRTSMGSRAVEYTYPFKTSTTVGIFSGLIFYLYYTVCLFIESFSFIPLLKFYLFFRHILTVIELMIAHLIAFVWWAVLCGALCFVMKNLNVSNVCFSFLFVYLVIMVMAKNARTALLIPVLLGVGVIIGSYYVAGPSFVRRYWSALFISTLVFNFFFILIFMFLSVVAHLFTQTTYVFYFHKTPSSDIMDTDADKLERIEELYDDYLKKHESNKENFFDKL